MLSVHHSTHYLKQTFLTNHLSRNQLTTTDLRVRRFDIPRPVLQVQTQTKERNLFETLLKSLHLPSLCEQVSLGLTSLGSFRSRLLGCPFHQTIQAPWFLWIVRRSRFPDSPSWSRCIESFARCWYTKCARSSFRGVPKSHVFLLLLLLLVRYIFQQLFRRIFLVCVIFEACESSNQCHPVVFVFATLSVHFFGQVQDLFASNFLCNLLCYVLFLSLSSVPRSHSTLEITLHLRCGFAWAHCS